MSDENTKMPDEFHHGITSLSSLDLQDLSSCKIHVSYEYMAMLQHEIEKQQHELENLKKTIHTLQDELDNTRETAARLYDLAPIGYVSLNSKGIIQHGNRMFAALLNMERTALTQQPFSTHVHDEDQMEWFDFLHRKQEKHLLHHCEVRLFRNEHGWFFAKLQCLSSPDKAPPLLIMVSDIDERKAMEAKAAEQQLQLFQASRMSSMGILAAGVAHEINNPNFLIMLNAPLLKMIWHDVLPILDQYYETKGKLILANRPFSEMRESVFEIITEMMHASERIKEIVQELGNYAKEPSWGPPEQVDINTIVMASIIMLSPTITESTHHFHVVYTPNLPPFQGCVQHLEQVVVNVLLNACQALPDKSRAIFVSTGFKTTSSTIQIEIRDEGIGINTETLKKIQDPFYAIHREPGVIGTGLAISSTIMREHGGKIDFFSEEGKGTTVRLLFPSTQASTIRSDT